MTLQEAQQFITIETKTKLMVRDSKEAAEIISQDILEKTNYESGAFYGPYKDNDGGIIFLIDK